MKKTNGQNRKLRGFAGSDSKNFVPVPWFLPTARNTNNAMTHPTLMRFKREPSSLWKKSSSSTARQNKQRVWNAANVARTFRITSRRRCRSSVKELADKTPKDSLPVKGLLSDYHFVPTNANRRLPLVNLRKSY